MVASRRARVLFAIPSMGMGGSELLMINLLRHIDRSRFEPHLTVLQAKGLRMQDVPSDVPVHELGGRARTAVFPLAQLCWRLRPLAVLSTSAHMNSALIAAHHILPKGTRLLLREGANVHSPEFGYGRLRLFVFKHTYRRADVVICQSDCMKEDLVERYGLSRFRVATVYNPVDIERISGLAESEQTPCFSDYGPNLIGVGRFSHEKGFDLLIRCMRMVCQVIPSVKLTLVGDGPDYPFLEALQKSLGLNGSVRFAGVQRNPYPFMKHADAVILPSRSEALPNVALEAIALGTRVIATNCTGALREIASCTTRMRIARDGTADSLAHEILAVLSQSNSGASRTPEPKFVMRFGLHSVTRQYERLLSTACKLDEGREWN